MAFFDKVGQVANKVGTAAKEGFDYSKAKAKIVSERGKIKDLKEELGAYVYDQIKQEQTVAEDKVMEFVNEIDEHVSEIEKLEAEAQESGEDFKETFKK